MNDIFSQYKNEFVKINEITVNLKENEQKAIHQSILRLTKSGEVFRAGRGIYGFFKKEIYSPSLIGQAKEISNILQNEFPLLDFCIIDTAFLANFMNLQPLSYIIVIETMKSAIDPIISALRKKNIMVYEQKDYPKIERYIKGSATVLVREQILSSPSPNKIQKIKFSSLEKILVDLVRDDNIFVQYQDVELENIYKNIIEKYAINYSKLLKYAKARNRKDECISFLKLTEEFNKVRGML